VPVKELAIEMSSGVSYFEQFLLTVWGWFCKLVLYRSGGDIFVMVSP